MRAGILGSGLKIEIRKGTRERPHPCPDPVGVNATRKDGPHTLKGVRTKTRTLKTVGRATQHTRI